MPRFIATPQELIAEAADALIRRDADRLYELALDSRNRPRDIGEGAAQNRLLAAMIEAAELLHHEPSAIIQPETDR